MTRAAASLDGTRRLPRADNSMPPEEVALLFGD
jgi:hypothetical protein